MVLTVLSVGIVLALLASGFSTLYMLLYTLYILYIYYTLYMYICILTHYLYYICNYTHYPFPRDVN